MRGQSQQQATRAVDGRSAPAYAVESASGGTLLQISTGVYFDGDCYETLHRAVYFTNLMRGTADDLSLPVGELQYSTDGGSVMISATDRLPKYDGNGEASPHVATGGIELPLSNDPFHRRCIVTPRTPAQNRSVPSGVEGRC